MIRLKPGMSARQSPNAAEPTCGSDWPNARPRPATISAALNHNERMRKHMRITYRGITLIDTLGESRIILTRFSQTTQRSTSLTVSTMAVNTAAAIKLANLNPTAI
jgi:hypothetical protein